MYCVTDVLISFNIIMGFEPLQNELER